MKPSSRANPFSSFRWIAACGVGLAVLFAQRADAAAYYISQIVGFSSGNLGSVGTAEKWSGGTASVTVTSGSGSLDAASVGLAPASGDKVDLSATDSLSTVSGFAGAADFGVSTSPSVYYSFLYRFNSLADVAAAGEVVGRVNRYNSGSGFHFYIVARSVSDHLEIGVRKVNGTDVYSPKSIAVGQTVLVVVRQKLLPGNQTSTEANDTVELWINPAPETLGVDEGLEPAPDTITTDGDDDTSNTGPGRFFIGGGLNSSFDEFRVARTWTDATPPASQCIPAAVLADPDPGVTIPAGINVTLKVTADGTSPAYQWETSTDGSLWTDVTGGTGGGSATYITPNLTLADSGKQFRCTVSVACDGSTASSAPSVVTVEAPTPTVIGTVMDDTFDDTTRDQPPVTAENSVWFSASGVLDASTGDLVALPAAGSSRLWLGYFTDDQTLPVLPVHLDIGRALRATLVFTASGITTTPSSSMRIGLFDYADGGTRPTSDNVGGSGGNGQGVRGYMMNLNFGTTFGADEPLSFYARNNLADANLMGTTAVYAGLGSGPDNGALNGTEAFLDGVEYTMELVVTRTGENSVTVGTIITGGGHTWTHTLTEDTYAYHRFDAIAIRANSLETSASSFTFTRFKVGVEEGVVPVMDFRITAVSKPDADSFSLTFESVAGMSYNILSRNAADSGAWTTNTVTATETATTYTATGLTGIPAKFFQVQLAP